MKTQYTILVIAISLFCTGCASNKLLGNDASLEQGVKRLVEEHTKALNAGDINQLMTFYADDASYSAPDKTPVQGKDAISHLKQTDESMFSYQFTMQMDDIQIENHSATAQVSYSKTKESDEDDAIVLSGVRVMELELQQNGKWIIKGDEWQSQQFAVNN